MKSRDKTRIKALTEGMAPDPTALLTEAADAVAALHDAVMAADDDAAEVAADRYDAAVLALNGGEFFGCMDRSNPAAGGILAEDHCRAAPGAVPSWGQCGEFLITVSGIRAVVVFGDGFGRLCHSFQFHAVDGDRPFISETGFRAHFEDARGGMTVEEVARAVFAAYLATDRTPVERRCRDDIEQRSWLPVAGAPTVADLTYVQADGQLTLGF